MKKNKKKVENQKESLECFLGLRDLAKKSGLSESFIRKLKSESNLPHYKVGGRVLFKFSEFNEWMRTEKRV